MSYTKMMKWNGRHRKGVRQVYMGFNPEGHTADSLREREESLVAKVQDMKASEFADMVLAYACFERWKRNNNYRISNDFEHNVLIRRFGNNSRLPVVRIYDERSGGYQHYMEVADCLRYCGLPVTDLKHKKSYPMWTLYTIHIHGMYYGEIALNPRRVRKLRYITKPKNDGI